jgi:hypothetical protein
VTHTLFSETGRLAKKAHNSQSKVNAICMMAQKTIFFGLSQKINPGKHIVSRATSVLRKMNGISRKP